MRRAPIYFLRLEQTSEETSRTAPGTKSGQRKKSFYGVLKSSPLDRTQETHDIKIQSLPDYTDGLSSQCSRTPPFRVSSDTNGEKS